ncbi:hypothetical protein E2C01_008452 [Portunus trituberculatus]|uniref:Uncharacterized protein n=1 Tax=Portunus trituberculatus TaxID=210409 RepID=A0A5B7D5F4_PORTR|nr:hypothetical protein [Portunus trituberculatus]
MHLHDWRTTPRASTMLERREQQRRERGGEAAPHKAPSCLPSTPCPAHTPLAEPMNLLSSSRGRCAPPAPLKSFIDATHSCRRLPNCVLTSLLPGTCRARLKTRAARPFVAPEDVP